jgi:hypothetical protein
MFIILSFKIQIGKAEPHFAVALCAFHSVKNLWGGGQQEILKVFAISIAVPILAIVANTVY